ncbi:hypothetical protein CEP52_008759 [Fusarium oligoseptatum]|uniref:Uncharacterized protein n=1 Tax=Fusarium oligoseptatum TaxID=2604345 RepID=A0A428TGG5_9HYPO|nr:hypothetical protein CEP52_008759 [Fusarium oligoseptatum]
MPFSFFRRQSTPACTDAPSYSPLDADDPNHLKVLDIVKSYLSPLDIPDIPDPPLVFRSLDLEGETSFTVQLPEPINPQIEAKILYVRFKKDAHGRDVVYLSMPQPTKSIYDLPIQDRLYNWPTYMGPNYQYGPITIMVENSTNGRWLSMTMHASFGAEYVDFRMKKCIMEQGENVTLTGPRPDGHFALGCNHLWS